jgi:PKD repeat protein
MLRNRCTAVLSGIAACLVLALPAGATPAAPTISAEQTAPLEMRLTSSTGTKWAWTILDAAGGPVATLDGNPVTVTLPAAGDYIAVLDTTDDDPLAPEAAHAEAKFHVYASPVAGFTSAQLADGTTQLSDASTGEPTGWTWTFPDNTTFEGPVPPPQALPVGTSTVMLTTTNPAGSSFISAPVFVNGAPVPVLSILSSPAAIDAPVRLDASRSTDPNNDALSYSWDLNGDGVFGDAAGDVQTVTYATSGRFRVAVQISDGRGATSTAEGAITVLADEPPVVDFTNDPLQPLVGTVVRFAATASDPDGKVVKIEWDLDDDGEFDDAAGPSATWTFRTDGPQRIAVRAVDDRRVATVVFRTIDVISPIPGGPPSVPLRAASTGSLSPSSAPVAATIPSATASSSTLVTLLTPFPVVRIRGQIFRGAVRFSLLRVQAPSGATIRVTCRGGSCAKKRADVRAKAVRQPLRVRALERRKLRAGTVIEVFVTAPNRIGKYTRFTVRRDSTPARVDQCLAPGHAKPTPCPVS